MHKVLAFNLQNRHDRALPRVKTFIYDLERHARRHTGQNDDPHFTEYEENHDPLHQVGIVIRLVDARDAGEAQQRLRDYQSWIRWNTISWILCLFANLKFHKACVSSNNARAGVDSPPPLAPFPTRSPGQAFEAFYDSNWDDNTLWSHCKRIALAKQYAALNEVCERSFATTFQDFRNSPFAKFKVCRVHINPTHPVDANVVSSLKAADVLFTAVSPSYTGVSEQIDGYNKSNNDVHLRAANATELHDVRRQIEQLARTDPETRYAIYSCHAVDDSNVETTIELEGVNVRYVRRTIEDYTESQNRRIMSLWLFQGTPHERPRMSDSTVDSTLQGCADTPEGI